MSLYGQPLSYDMGTAVIDAWRAQGIGIPDVLARKHTLIVPLHRHDATRLDPIVIDMGYRVPGQLIAEVTDPQVLAAVGTYEAYDVLVLAGGVEADRDTLTGDYLSLYVDEVTLPAFARAVWTLAQMAQRVVDYAEGVDSGQYLARVRRAQDTTRGTQV